MTCPGISPPQLAAVKLGRERQMILEFLQVRGIPGDAPCSGLIDDRNRRLKRSLYAEPRVEVDFIGS